MSDLDFTLMYAAHDAFRRDLRRLTAAARDGRGADPAVQAGWDVFTRQLDLHHQAEDAALWPQMREKLASRPDDLALLDEMEAEHAGIDPLLDSVDTVLGDPDPVRLREHAANLSAVLNHHLDHEESAGLPLVAEMLDNEAWNALAVDMRRRQGLKGAAVFFPWLLDEAPPERRHHILGLLPPPVRLLYRLVWRPRYAPTRKWATPQPAGGLGRLSG